MERADAGAAVDGAQAWAAASPWEGQTLLPAGVQERWVRHGPIAPGAAAEGAADRREGVRAGGGGCCERWAQDAGGVFGDGGDVWAAAGASRDDPASAAGDAVAGRAEAIRAAGDGFRDRRARAPR